jgi:hypothetical protein
MRRKYAMPMESTHLREKWQQWEWAVGHYRRAALALGVKTVHLGLKSQIVEEHSENGKILHRGIHQHATITEAIKCLNSGGEVYHNLNEIYVSALESMHLCMAELTINLEKDIESENQALRRLHEKKKDREVRDSEKGMKVESTKYSEIKPPVSYRTPGHRG